MGSAFPESILQAAIREGRIGADQPLAAFMDAATVRAAVRDLFAAFPTHFSHTFAAKANSLRRALELARGLVMGCEVASPGELEQALRAGVGALVGRHVGRRANDRCRL